jgi:hypothetical protein
LEFQSKMTFPPPQETLQRERSSSFSLSTYFLLSHNYHISTIWHHFPLSWSTWTIIYCFFLKAEEAVYSPKEIVGTESTYGLQQLNFLHHGHWMRHLQAWLVHLLNCHVNCSLIFLNATDL